MGHISGGKYGFKYYSGMPGNLFVGGLRLEGVPAVLNCQFSGRGLLELRQGWQWLGSWPAITAFLTATALEIGAYYVPWLDNLLDSTATPASGIAGMLMTVAVMPADVTRALAIHGGVYYDDLPAKDTHVA